MRRTAQGFSLMEVLLATSLLAAALALAFAVLRSAGATVTRGELLAARNERVRAVSGFLRSRIGAALPMVFALDPDTGRSVRFAGTADAVRFVAEVPAYLERGGPQVHVLKVQDGPEGDKALLLTLQSLSTQAPLAAPEPLVQGLRQFELAYRGLDAQGRWTPWSARWPQPDVLPRQVRIRIRDAQGAWPPLIVTLPLAGSEGGGQP
ncbi:prepilin-type N-terminal cleavage/methylation domain-containing protein [Thermomonas hydrothermalis]|uniref:General secretion pathway protein J n=1 Tax=Thermomonas hydrothermalis TaxID=213588 RepID=A0A1M4W7M3_9GAMM|nr:prepilin-type N-terminal cleavage/methylation domain-containing protein [Thermomonas hydrothermalis]MCL6619508.1 prepilin-type N-terminal cleavage/methylation domain-containing protein [Thermomonas hydrothermalis]SHE77261.1 general secretion pathway protein J [Thermomonas hydrothermalis]